MTPRSEAETLRQRLNQLADEFDANIKERYALHFPPPKPSLYRRLRTNAGRVLRRLGLMRPLVPQPPPPIEPWLTELSYVDYGSATKPLLIWALGIERDKLRSICDRIRKLQSSSPGWAPVLVTDVADFAFFSRLSWLVEYVPSLSPPADGYFEHKLRCLAWRYRDMPALSISAEIRDNMLLEDLLID